jgi:hypothetical protein
MVKTTACTLLVAGALTADLTIGQGRQMTDLTVPAQRLPPGCRLSTPPDPIPGDGRVEGVSWSGFPTNPWMGTERRLVGSIRQRIEAPLPILDAAGPSRAAQSRTLLVLAEGLAEGYAAFYAQPDSAQVAVYAVRWSGRDRASFGQSDRSSRIVIGPIVARVWGDGGRCARQIEAYLRGMAE